MEGHTDNVQGSGRGAIKDNWDLSVMRATSVVKILLNNTGLNPLQLTSLEVNTILLLQMNLLKEEK